MPTIQYRISSRIHGGKTELLARFYNGNFSERAKTRIIVPADAWDAETERLIIPRRITPETAELHEIQQQLDQLTAAVYNAWYKDRFDATKGWLQQVIDDALNHKPRTEHKTLRDVYEEYRSAKDIDVATRRQYEVMLSAIERFSGKKILYVDKITAKDIDAFCQFYRKEKRANGVVERSQNTITGKLKRWRALQNFAVLRGYAQTSPFAQFTIPSEVYGTPIFLTTEERDSLYRFEPLTPSLRIQRDIFVFQCHVGCRVSDLVSLTKDNITDDGFLQYIPQKQRRRVPITVRVPLSSVAKEIVQRYSECHGEHLLPFIHPNKYNEAIHDFMKLAGMDRVVIVPNKLTMQPENKRLWEITTSHTARKTFIEAMFRETKSERITSSFTGHSDGSRAFSRYTDVDDAMKRDIISKMDGEK